MSLCAVINEFFVIIDAIYSRIRHARSDFWALAPVFETVSDAGGLFGNQVRAGSFMAAEKNVQIIIFIGPYDRAIVMVTLCWPECYYIGELAGNRIISDSHRFGSGLLLIVDLAASVKNNMNFVVEIDRLRSLPAVIEHLDLPAMPKRHG